MHDHLRTISGLARRHRATACSLGVHGLLAAALLWTWTSPSPRVLADRPDAMTVLLLGANSLASSAAQSQVPSPATAPAPRRRPSHPVATRLHPTAKVTTVAATPPEPSPTLAVAPAATTASASAAVTASAAATASTAASAPVDADISTPPPTEYLRRVSRIISMSQKYPWSARQDGQQGDVIVRMHLARTGHVLAATLVRSSGVAALDLEARDVVLRIARFPPFPADYIPQIAEFDIDQPVSFRHYLN